MGWGLVFIRSGKKPLACPLQHPKVMAAKETQPHRSSCVQATPSTAQNNINRRFTAKGTKCSIPTGSHPLLHWSREILTTGHLGLVGFSPPLPKARFWHLLLFNWVRKLGRIQEEKEPHEYLQQPHCAVVGRDLPALLVSLASIVILSGVYSVSINTDLPPRGYQHSTGRQWLLSDLGAQHQGMRLPKCFPHPESSGVGRWGAPAVV